MQQISPQMQQTSPQMQQLPPQMQQIPPQMQQIPPQMQQIPPQVNTNQPKMPAVIQQAQPPNQQQIPKSLQPPLYLYSSTQNYDSNYDPLTYGELKRVDQTQNKTQFIPGQPQTQNYPSEYRTIRENNVNYNVEPQNIAKTTQNTQNNYRTFNENVAFYQSPQQQNFGNVVQSHNTSNFGQENRVGQKENKNYESMRPEEKETKESLERLRMEIMNSKKIIENYEKNKKNTEVYQGQRMPFNEMASFSNNNNNNLPKPSIFKVEAMDSKNEQNSMNSLKIAHKSIIERNKKLDVRLEEVLKKSQAITKTLK